MPEQSLIDAIILNNFHKMNVAAVVIHVFVVIVVSIVVVYCSL